MPLHPDKPLSAQLFAASLLAAMRLRGESSIICSTAAFTYQRACSAANGIAHALSGIGSGPVAICAAKSPETVAAVLGVMKSGRAYAPLDSSHPAARLGKILECLSPSALIVDSSTKQTLPQLAEAAGIPVLVLEHLNRNIHGDQAETDCALAAILHTSGSTGVPKQAQIGADALQLFADWVREEFELSPQDCILSHAPLAFDLSFLDIFASLSAGASIVLADADEARNGEMLARMIERNKVTFLHAAPSALSLLVQAAKGSAFPHVRAVLFAGEPISRVTLDGLMTAFPNARLTNIYGCTETNDTFFYDVPRAGAPDPLPLGSPLPHVKYLILDRQGLPVQANEDGILWVACPTMMNGYSDAALTKSAFAQFGGDTYYNTKDRVRLGGDGLLRFLGRTDTVKKINGYRIDLSEVEACISRIDGVGEAAVFERNSEKGSHIAAAISSKDPALTPLSVRVRMMKFLPPHAIPKHVTIMAETLPKNSNGKICRKTLAGMTLQ